MFRQHAYEFERHAGRTEPQHVADAQCHMARHALVVDERAVGAVVLDDCLAVHAGSSVQCDLDRPAMPRAGAARAARRRSDQPSVSGSADDGPGAAAKQHVGWHGVRRALASESCSTAHCPAAACDGQAMHQRDRLRGGRAIESRAASAPSAAAPRGNATTSTSRSAARRADEPGQCRDAMCHAQLHRETCGTRAPARVAARRLRAASTAAVNCARRERDTVRAVAESHLDLGLAGDGERGHPSRQQVVQALLGRAFVQRIEPGLPHELAPRPRSPAPAGKPACRLPRSNS